MADSSYQSRSPPVRPQIIAMTELSKEEIEKEILSLGTEDDYGLYEIIWRLNSMYPNFSEQEKISAAAFAVRELLQEKLIELFWSKNHELIPMNSTEKLPNDPKSWSPKENVVSFATTSKGDERYFKR